MKETEKMEVKKGLEKEYEDYVKKNQDGYGNAVIVAGAKVGKALSEGKTCKEAHNEMYKNDLTGFMAGCLASAISHFHSRGEEFKEFWNRQYGIKNAKGVVNPAIITIKDKKEDKK